MNELCHVCGVSGKFHSVLLLKEKGAIGERQRGYFDLGADRIGARLRRPDTEWLQSVFENWRAPEIR